MADFTSGSLSYWESSVSDGQSSTWIKLQLPQKPLRFNHLLQIRRLIWSPTWLPLT